jgi:hypothetical protein
MSILILRPQTREHAPMTGLPRTASLTSALDVVRVVFAVAVLGSCAVGLSAQANASPCIPDTLAMTPQPQLSCPGAQVAPRPVAAPVAAPADDSAGPSAPDGPPAPGPVDVAAGPPPPAFPAPGQAPFIPPVVGEDGAPTQSFGQSGYLGEIWHEFHNGVPGELIYGPAAPPPPGAPMPPPAP